MSSHALTPSHSFLYMAATIPSRPNESVDSSNAEILPVALTVSDIDPVDTLMILGDHTCVLELDDLA